MLVTKNENIAYCDVDETLIKWCDWKETYKIQADYHGEKVFIKPHKKHIQFLKSLKARGFYIVVHSNNGWAWAEQIVKLLNLEAYVDEVKTKPSKVLDDSPYENWLPKIIYLDDK